jgi:hypothetical protein
MRYLVKAKLKPGKAGALLSAIDERRLGRGSIAGDEYLHDMKTARVNDEGEARWVETCFCDPPLDEERPYWENFSICSEPRTRTPGGIVARRTVRNNGPVAIAIARSGSKKGWRGQVKDSSRNCVQRSIPGSARVRVIVLAR